VRILFELAPNTAVDVGNVSGGTALMGAASYLHLDVVKLLIDHGANVNLANFANETPLSAACGETNPGEEPRDPDPGGTRQVATVRALLQLGAGTLPSFPPLPHPTTTRLLLLRNMYSYTCSKEIPVLTRLLRLTNLSTLLRIPSQRPIPSTPWAYHRSPWPSPPATPRSPRPSWTVARTSTSPRRLASYPASRRSCAPRYGGAG